MQNLLSNSILCNFTVLVYTLTEHQNHLGPQTRQGIHNTQAWNRLLYINTLAKQSECVIVFYLLLTVKAQRFGSNKKLKKEINLFMVLLRCLKNTLHLHNILITWFSIVVAFLILHAPRIIVDVYEFMHLEVKLWQSRNTFIDIPFRIYFCVSSRTVTLGIFNFYKINGLYEKCKPFNHDHVLL